MPYTMLNLPNAIKKKSNKEKEVFIAAFNSTYKNTNSEQQSWIAAIGAMKNVAPKTIKKSIVPDADTIKNYKQSDNVESEECL